LKSKLLTGLPSVIPKEGPSREKTEQPPGSGFVFLFFEFFEKQAFDGITFGDPKRGTVQRKNRTTA
jgi:hypothetical protein